MGALTAILMLLLLIQTGLYFHGRSVAQHAAQQGLDAGRSYDATGGDAQSAAERYIAKMGGSLNSSSVTVDSGGGQLGVTVRGEVVSLLPGLLPGIEQRVQAPKERWSP